MNINTENGNRKRYAHNFVSTKCMVGPGMVSAIPHWHAGTLVDRDKLSYRNDSVKFNWMLDTLVHEEIVNTILCNGKNS